MRCKSDDAEDEDNDGGGNAKRGVVSAALLEERVGVLFPVCVLANADADAADAVL